MNLDEVVSRFERVHKAGKGYSCRCPGHDDNKNSLSATPADGKILIKCHAGCETESILAAVGLKLSDLYSSNSHGHDPVIKYYPYADEHGEPLFRVCRTASKDFKAQRYESGQYVWGLNGTRRVPYNLPAVIGSKYVLIVEGEKDVETLREHGLIATTNPFGAGKWDD